MATGGVTPSPCAAIESRGEESDEEPDDIRRPPHPPDAEEDEEPDDDVRVPAPALPEVVTAAPLDRPTQLADGGSVAAVPAGGLAQEDAEVDEVEEPFEPLSLGKHWQQLEGVACSWASRRGRAARSQRPRYLAWNVYGHVVTFPRQRRMETRYAQHKESQLFPDSIVADMASISKDICCVAAGADAEGGPRILVRPADRWEHAAFGAALGDATEAPEAIACGDGFVAALTSRRLLRIYGPSGLPLGMLSVPGRSVALAARGPLLLVVTGDGDMLCDDVEEALDFRLLDVRARCQRAMGRLPLSRGTRLRWVSISADLVPIAIDTAGMARALLASGPGSWGPAGGGCFSSEWVPVLDLASLEARQCEDGGVEGKAMGACLLWSVMAGQSVLLVAELGLDTEAEPWVPFASDDLPVRGHCWGVGARLREIPWRLPIGPLSMATAAAEEALRVQLLAHHLEEIQATGLASVVGDDVCSRPCKTWRSKSLFLFGEFLKAGELERALDVARSFLAGGAGQTLLTNAKVLAENVGFHRLVNEIEKLAMEPSARIDAGRPQGKKRLPPLFQLGEFDSQVQSSGDGTTVPPIISTPAHTETAVAAAPVAKIGNRDAVRPCSGGVSAVPVNPFARLPKVRRVGE